MNEERLQEIQNQLEQRSRQLEAAFKITSRLYSRIELDAMLQETLHVALEVVGADAGTIFLYDPDRDELVFRYVIGEKSAELTGKGIKPTQGIAGEVFQTGNPKITADARADPQHMREVGERIKYITRDMVTVPLKSIEGQCIGVMQVLNKQEGMFDEYDVEVLSILSVLAATAIENVRLLEAVKLAMVTKMLGDISHDIKNMLTPVITGVQTLEAMLQAYKEDFAALEQSYEESSLEHKVLQSVAEAFKAFDSFFSEAVEMIMDGSSSIQERVRELADCVKGIVSEPHFEMADVMDVAAKVIKALKPYADKQGVELKMERVGEIPLILIDQKRMYNAIYNLVNNAIPETPSGGSVTVRSYAVEDGPFPQGNYLMVEVADTGRGMPPHVREKLFTDKAVSTKPGGTGLGTRIVKNVVDSHGGVIKVDSWEGKGTTFYMKLPLRWGNGEGGERRKARSDSSRGEGRKIE